MRKFLTLLSILFLTTNTFAQTIIKGVIKDNQTNQAVPGATIITEKNAKSIANDNGEFTVTLTKDEEKIKVVSIGYLDQDVIVKKSNSSLLILLTPSNYNLNEVQVTGWSTKKKDNQLTEGQSVGILTSKDFQRGNGLFPENQMNTIPGVFMQTRGISGGQRIIIRGYGNNTNFNGLGYQVFLNGIPLTDATGLTILDDVDFSTIGKVEVFKGPESSLYGAGIAGVVNFYSIKPEPNRTKIIQDNTFGSWGLYRNNTRIESAGSNSALFFNYGHQTSNGYRDHSASMKDYATLKGDFYVGDKQTISTYLSYNRSYEELAGELAYDTIYSRKTWSDPTYLKNNAHILIESFRAGVSDNIKIDKHFSNESSLFTSGYNLDQPSAAGLTDNSVLTFGGRTGFVFDNNAGKVGVHGILGGQFEKTLAFNKSYNLPNTTGLLGAIKGDLQVQSSVYNVFTEWKFNLPNNFILTTGASLNFTEYVIRDMLTNTANPTHADQSGYKRFAPVFKPRISLLKMLSKDISVYANVSTGYTAPSTSNAIIPAIGKVNTDLKPESGIQYEIGTKGTLSHNRLSYQVALFELNVNDKIVNQTVPAAGSTPSYTFATNVGKQQNVGAEISLSYLAIYDKTKIITVLRPFITYTYSDFKYKDFKSDNNNNASTLDFSNNKVAGVAPNFVNIGIDVETKVGVYFNATYQYVDKLPYTFDNKNYTQDYRLLGAKIGYRNTFNNHFSVDVFAGADNLLNNTYYTFLFLSSTLSSQTDPHFIPGAYNATYYGGLKLAYTF